MDKIANIKDVSIGNCVDSQYLKPIRMHFTQNKKRRIWDMMMVHNSVSVIIYNSTFHTLMFVKQFRPAIYLHHVQEVEGTEIVVDGSTKIDTNKHPPSCGITLELCAGIVDKDLSLEEIAKEEILEECGYDVPLSNLERVVSYRTGIGSSGALGTLFYAEISDEMKVTEGGGNQEEGEMIEVIHLPAEEALDYLWKDTINKPSGVLMSVMWFTTYKLPKILECRNGK